MTDNEKFVRDRWEYVDLAHDLKKVWVIVGTVHLNPNGHRETISWPPSTEAEAWSAAKAFTVRREEEIRQVEASISLLQGWKFVMQIGDSPAKHTLAREQAHLDTLRRGMKTEGGTK